MFAAVQAMIEKHLQDNWSANPLVFENQPINTELFDEWTRCTIQYGNVIRKTMSGDLYRVVGVLFLSFYVRPATGINHSMVLLDNALTLLENLALSEVGTPTVYFLESSVTKNMSEKVGWVSSQLAYSFYFDHTP